MSSSTTAVTTPSSCCTPTPNASALFGDCILGDRTNHTVTVTPSATTLLDRQRYSVRDLADLYHGRWSIEELYKISKQLLTVEEFHGQTERTVQQELFAHFSLIALARLFTNRSEESFRADPGKPVMQANFKSSLRTVARHLEGLFLEHAATLGKTVERILAGIAACRQRQRPNRSFPRLSRKPASKWRSIKPATLTKKPSNKIQGHRTRRPPASMSPRRSPGRAPGRPPRQSRIQRRVQVALSCPQHKSGRVRWEAPQVFFRLPQSRTARDVHRRLHRPEDALKAQFDSSRLRTSRLVWGDRWGRLEALAARDRGTVGSWESPRPWPAERIRASLGSGAHAMFTIALIALRGRPATVLRKAAEACEFPEASKRNLCRPCLASAFPESTRTNR